MNEYESLMEQEIRRRKLMDAMMTPRTVGTEMVSGRAVPYTNAQGMATLGQALINKYADKRANERLEQARLRQEQKRQNLIDAVMEKYRGTPGQPATPYELSPEQQFYEGEQIPGLQNAPVQGTPPNPQEAMLLAASQPETQPMVAAMKSTQTPQASMFYTYETDAKGNLWKLPGRPGEEPEMVKTAEGKPVQSARYSPERLGAISEAKKAGEVTGKERTMAAIDLPKVKSDAEYLKELVNAAKVHPGMKGAIGIPNVLTAGGLAPGTKEADFLLLHKQILGKQFMQAYQTLKGGGQITEIEGQKATEALSRMGRASSEKEYLKAADDFISEIDRLTALAEQRATGKTPQKSASTVLKFDAQGNQIQ